MIQSPIPMIHQGRRYSLGAVGSALTDWVVFLLLDLLAVPILADQVFARMAGGLFSFLVNKHWSFQAGNSHRLSREMPLFLFVYIASFTLSLVLFYSAVSIIHIPPYPAKIGADTLCFLFNFFMMRCHVFSPLEPLKNDPS